MECGDHSLRLYRRSEHLGPVDIYNRGGLMPDAFREEEWAATGKEKRMRRLALLQETAGVEAGERSLLMQVGSFARNPRLRIDHRESFGDKSPNPAGFDF